MGGQGKFCHRVFGLRACFGVLGWDVFGVRIAESRVVWDCGFGASKRLLAESGGRTCSFPDSAGQRHEPVEDVALSCAESEGLQQGLRGGGGAD